MIKLINGDCMKVELPKCRLLLTDIPYDNCNKTSNGLRIIDKGKANEITFNLQEFLDKIYDCFDICIIFCEHKQFSPIMSYFDDKQKKHKGTVRQVIWAKTNPSPMNGEYVYLSGTENAIWFKKKGTGKLNCKCKRNIFNFPIGSSKFVPTEKNHKLLKDLILDNTNENDIILDTCMGGGSTGIVAVENNRNFIGIELDKEKTKGKNKDQSYFDIAVERIKNTQKEYRE